MDFEKYLDVEYLKSLGKTPHWFGLGFIQLKISPNKRLHFWDPKLSTLVNPSELHDHRYGFTSTILAGDVEHEVFSFEPKKNGSYEMCEVFCQPEKSAPPARIEVGDIHFEGFYKMAPGSRYTFPVGRFHKGASLLAVTYLERETPSKETARIIRPLSNDWTCPFSGKLSEEGCWQAISDIISSARR